ncbi:MAG: DUF58 domain-containing protein [Gammaproteobacteria bacterium]
MSKFDNQKLNENLTGRNQGRPAADVIQGAYVSIEQLLRLRFRVAQKTTPNNPVRTGSQSGLRLSKHKGRGVDFAEVRQYQPGDDIRSIDWRVTARKNSPHTKVFREERESPAQVFVDQTQPMFFGSVQRLKSVAAAELAGRLAWRITHQGDRVGGLVLDIKGHTVFRPFRTAKAVGRLLQQVATSNQLLHKPEGLVDNEVAAAFLTSALDDLAQLKHQRFRIFVVADLVGSADSVLQVWQRALPRIAQKHDLTILQISDPLDHQLPPAGFYSVSQGDRQLHFHTGDGAARQAYTSAYRKREEALKALCRHPSINYLTYSTADEQWDGIDLGLKPQGRMTP